MVSTAHRIHSYMQWKKIMVSVTYKTHRVVRHGENNGEQMTHAKKALYIL